MSDIPCNFLAMTKSLTRSMTRSGPMLAGSSVTTIPRLRALTCSIFVRALTLNVPLPVS